jgi:hypothetical protein
MRSKADLDERTSGSPNACVSATGEHAFDVAVQRSHHPYSGEHRLARHVPRPAISAQLVPQPSGVVRKVFALCVI